MDETQGPRREAARNPVGATVLLVAMIVVIVGLDVIVFRSSEWTWERLASNVGVVLIFGAFYFRFFAA